MPSVSPFPWRSLDSVRRVDIELLAKMRRAAARLVDLAGAEGAFREMLGASDFSVQLRRVSSSSPRIDEAAVGVLLAPGERADRRRSFAIIIENALATALAGRVLRRASPRLVDATRPSPSLAGAMGAILVAAARRNGLAPLRIIDAAPAHAIVGDLVGIDANPVTATFTVLLEHDAYLIHALAPRSALEPLGEPEMTARSLFTLGQMPLEVPLLGARLAMTATEIASLAPGDVLLPIDCKHLELAPAQSDVAFGVDVADGGRLVLRDDPHPLFEEETLDKEALAQSIGETPVVVRVEVGMAQMTAREWAGLGSGDVISLGKRIGEHVVLRVGGVEVARGELVDVEGEMGVRIVARSGDTVA